ncbi:MAG: site-2 protease family protein [Rhodospirillaceae bacterium]|nr:site-2 protease family protein [Rhodospirillaceae bacterium]
MGSVVDSELSLIESVVAYGLPTLLAITLHEAAHGYVAYLFGDPTAKNLGRLSLNPIRHIDLVGTILLPAMLKLAGSPFLFGWAKPVPVDARHFRRPRQDMMWVAAAGPAMNLLLAMASARLMHVIDSLPAAYQNMAQVTLEISLVINVLLGVLNMLPIPPLDGGKVLVGLLPAGLARRLAQVEKYGMLPLLLILVGLPMLGSAIGVNLNPVGWVVLNISDWIVQLIASLSGLSASGG